MDVNKNVKHTSLDRVSPVYAVSTVVVSFERRERTNMFMVQDPGITLKTTVNGATRFVHVVHDKVEVLCHV